MTNPSLDDLKDIVDINGVPWWPPAPIWWAIAAIALFSVLYCCYRLSKYIAFKNSWRHTIFKQLLLLEKNVYDSPASEQIADLSKYIRLINVRKFGRADCASLTGDNWINWLNSHDPKKYDWSQHKDILLSQYQYPNRHDDKLSNEILKITGAIKIWLKS